MSRLSERVRAWRRANPGGVLVAVSGGPDSVALLLALVGPGCQPGPEAALNTRHPNPETPTGWQPVATNAVAAHLNHQLRGAESDADEAFTRDLCAQVGVPFVCHRLDIAALARASGENVEAVARQQRYAWLREVAREHGLPMVATGHTASDQAETVLHRLLRGTGIEGLRGIAPRRPLGDGVDLVRPLLDVSRADVLEYLRLAGVTARHDATNDDTSLTRNRIRHELLPLLARDYNPRVEEVLARLATQAEETFAEEESRAAELLARAERPRAGERVVLDAAELVGASRGVLRSALRVLWQREGWPMAGMGMDHWEGVAAVCRGEAAARDLPGGVRARRVGGVVQVRMDRGEPGT